MATINMETFEMRDFVKFTKYFALKTAQVIVHARTGDKQYTKCKTEASGPTWVCSFNLNIVDEPELTNATKHVLCPNFVHSAVPFTIEVSLKTPEDDVMVLEAWSLRVSPEIIDPMLPVNALIYTKMGFLLRSLIAISRTMPAYKLSRTQGPESFDLSYNIYMGDPMNDRLGEDFKYLKIGHVPTPGGTVHLGVSYRTQMTISPTHNSRESIMLKSDHFHSDLSPRHARYQPRLVSRLRKQKSDENSKSTGEKRVGAFVIEKQAPLKEEDLIIPDVPFSVLLTPRRKSQPSNSMFGLESGETAVAIASTSPASVAVATVSTDSNNGNGEKAGADNATPKINSRNGSRRSSSLVNSVNDDFIMVDLKTPFAIPNPNTELGHFYKECRHPPQLRAHLVERTLEEQLGDVTKTLETFESNMQQFEEIVSTLCRSENSEQ